MSAFADVGSLRPQQLWEGVLGRTVHGERVTFSVVELAPGAIVPEHSHANEQVGLLLEGALVFRIGEETRERGPGSAWCIPGGVLHEVTAGAEGAVAVEVFAPVREDWRSIAEEPPRAPLWPRNVG